MGKRRSRPFGVVRGVCAAIRTDFCCLSKQDGTRLHRGECTIDKIYPLCIYTSDDFGMELELGACVWNERLVFGPFTHGLFHAKQNKSIGWLAGCFDCGRTSACSSTNAWKSMIFHVFGSFGMPKMPGPSARPISELSTSRSSHYALIFYFIIANNHKTISFGWVDGVD